MEYSKAKSLFPVFIGFSIWLLALVGRIPYSIFDLTHVEALLIAAPLWLIPFSFYISKKKNWIIWLALICGILFTAAYHFPKGIIAGSLVIPWFACSIYLLIKKGLSILPISHSTLKQKVELAAYLYLPIGVCWAIIDRLDIPFFGYSPTIILLTAVHFHYAGFILPQVTSWLIKNQSGFIYKLTGYGIILGIPLVAVGISATHFNWPVWVEVLSVSIMTIAGAVVGLLHLGLGFKSKNGFQKISFGLGGLALLVGMSLAFCYGWRHVFIIETLTIPWMYAVHGTCNAVGFAFPVLLGWHQKNII